VLSGAFTTLSGMLATQSAQVGMFDVVVLARPLPEGSFYALVAEHCHRIVRDEDFGGIDGRPRDAE
jgi:hypothetical protein